MPNVFEKLESPDTESKENKRGGSASIGYGVTECPDGATARALALAFAPLFVEVQGETLIRQSAKAKVNGPDYFDIEVGYGREDNEASKPPPEPGAWELSFDTTGGRRTITQAQMISRHWGVLPNDPDAPTSDANGQPLPPAPSSEAPDLKGALNYDGKKVHGTEVPAPNLSFTIKAWYRPQDVSTNFMREAARKTPRFNSDDGWLGFSAGEVLYLGSKGKITVATIRGAPVQPVAIEHEFAGSENTTISIPGITQGKNAAAEVVTSIVKRGWDYFWIWFHKAANDEKVVIPVPLYAYVNQPHDPLDFGAFFGFGGSSGSPTR